MGSHRLFCLLAVHDGRCFWSLFVERKAEMRITCALKLNARTSRSAHLCPSGNASYTRAGCKGSHSQVSVLRCPCMQHPSVSPASSTSNTLPPPPFSQGVPHLWHPFG
eukprot:1157418-Pelagomonas_calceolata.AAC.3